MNTAPTPDAPTSVDLPELTDDRVFAIEHALFDDIARERRQLQQRRARRGRAWLVGGAAAAIVVVAAVIAPSVSGMIRGASMADGVSVTNAPAWGTIPYGSAELDAADGAIEFESADDASFAAEERGARSADLAEGVVGDAGRDIITTASATLVVGDVADAAREIDDAASARGGYVESMQVGQSRAVAYDSLGGPEYGRADYAHYPYPVSGAWVSVRVPSAELSGLIAELSDIGEVSASSINRQDVSEQAVDLRARIEAAQASVDRLTELMTQAGDLGELITAEQALSERQATLESYQQRLESLEGQVAMSTLTVSLTPEVERVEANPAGFADGLATGWNGLVATLNGIVVALGFLLPWLGVLGLAGLIVWLIVRTVRRRRIARFERDSFDPEGD